VTESFELTARGPFSLAAAVRFQQSFPAGTGGGAPDRLDLAFPADGDWATVGVRVTGDGDGLRGRVVANPAGLPVASIRSQVERILSLDVDGTGFAAVTARDPVVRDLWTVLPGLRPVLFASPYEAAAWAILSHRVRMTQAGAVRRRIAGELGDRVDFGDRHLSAFPRPERLIELAPGPGLTLGKLGNLRSLGHAAADGELDAGLLRQLSHEEALAHLQRLPGIGPFSAELILIRGAGDPDVFPSRTPRLHVAMADAYDLGPEPRLAALEAIADGWRPYRSWVAFLLRNAAGPAPVGR
jgi:DNA-3-methyladenine glycosylase II